MRAIGARPRDATTRDRRVAAFCAAHTDMSRRGLLLLQLGTPEAPTPTAVRRYLREFLSDPRVIDLPSVLRCLLLNLVILPFRPRRSAEAYKKIWTDAGSPLLVHGLALEKAVQARLGDGWMVRLAMRYGRPSLGTALDEMADCEQIVALPLYPQYSSATTGSSLEHLYREAGARFVTPNVVVVPSFFCDVGFLSAVAAVGRSLLSQAQPDHVLFSYHGLPERQVKAGDKTGQHCLLSDGCCAQLSRENAHCYRAQCFQTSRSLAEQLALEPGTYTTCFQSRLGRARWISPSTNEVLASLPSSGNKRVVVFCPSFVADCLETLEEIGMRSREAFLKAGGEMFVLVPSLNGNDAWADAVTDLAQRHTCREAPIPREKMTKG